MDELSTLSADIKSYQGTSQEPRWTDIEPGVHWLLIDLIGIH